METPKRETGRRRMIKFIPATKKKKEEDEKKEVTPLPVVIQVVPEKKEKKSSSKEKKPSKEKKSSSKEKSKKSKTTKKEKIKEPPRSRSAPRTSREFDKACFETAAKIKKSAVGKDDESSSSSDSDDEEVHYSPAQERGRGAAQNQNGLLTRLARSMSPGTKRRARNRDQPAVPRILRRKEKKKEEDFMTKIEKYGIEAFEDKEMTPSEEAIFWKVQGSMQDAIDGSDVEGDY
jgi:hypothetical protein